MTNEESIRILKEIYSCTNTTLMQENISFERERILLDDCNALTMAIEALEKQIPQNPIRKNGLYLCPKCDTSNILINDCTMVIHFSFCDCCGQAILWEDGI